MVHHSFSTVGLGGADGCPGALRKGDIYTHTYHGFPSTLVETDPATEGACVQYRFVEQIALLKSLTPLTIISVVHVHFFVV